MNTDEIKALRKRREEIGQQLVERQNKLTAIKTLIATSGRMENSKFATCLEAKQKHVLAIQHLTKESARIKCEIRDAENAIYASSCVGANASTASITKPIVEELVALRAEYQEFSADFTRVSSMRQMAADFILKLNPIIRRAVNGEI